MPGARARAKPVFDIVVDAELELDHSIVAPLITLPYCIAGGD